jgi:hypothetical protein
MKQLLLFFVTILCACAPSIHELPVTTFPSCPDPYEYRRNLEEAGFCSRYEFALAHSSSKVIAAEGSLNSVLNNIGPESFAFPSGEDFEVFYGSYEPRKDSFHIRYHYLVTPEAEIADMSTGKLDTALLHYPRAVNQCLDTINKYMQRLKIRFVHVVGLNRYGTWVRVFPAVQYDSSCAAGVEAFWQFDSSGQRLLRYSMVNNGLSFFKIEKPGTVILQNTETNVPTIENLLFVMNFRKNFTNILIRCKTYFYSVVDLRKGGWNLYPYLIDDTFDDRKMKVHRQIMRQLAEKSHKEQ